MQTIEHSLLISFMVFAIHYTFMEGEIFGWAGRLLSRLPGWLRSPIYECPVCMVFWYGYAIYWLTWHVCVSDWIITVITAMGINVVLLWLMPDKNIPGYHKELEDIARELNINNKFFARPVEKENIKKPIVKRKK